MVDVVANLRGIQSRLADAMQRRGEGPPVRLIAVSKRHSTEAIVAAYDAGQRDFGENYAQELEEKSEALAQRCPEIRWHMIGPLQRNKVPKILGCSMLHTVDRGSLVQALEKRAASAQRTLSCLVQVNPGEAQKSGISEGELPALLETLGAAQHLRCAGLMLIPPNDGPEARRGYFAWLARLGEQHRACFEGENPELSMGMSSDFEDGILAGATLVRVGSAIFGPRPDV